MPFGLYIHIPFCVKKCKYCNFYSFGGYHAVPDEYIDALEREFWRHSPSRGVQLHPDTVYLGGGTPSLLTPKQVSRILTLVAPRHDAEITIEANPGDLTLESLDGYLKAGVNRISIGVQTSSNESLSCLGRRHSAEEARHAIRIAKQAGFQNISGDLMLALPGYTNEECKKSISLLAEEEVTHISSYLLKIEEHTPFQKEPPPNLPSEDQAAEFYLYAVEELEQAGYKQYEISNFSKPGFESRHNLIYWNCNDYLGVGPSAHSCMEGIRFSYPPNLKTFIAHSTALFADGECTAQDFIMLQLRLSTGLDLSELKRAYGISFTAQQLSFLRECENRQLCHLQNNRLTLTTQGMLVQNSILCHLI